mgnify:CR=1 FL=1
MTKAQRKIKYISKIQQQKYKCRLFETMTNDFNNFMNYANKFVNSQKATKNFANGKKEKGV